MSRIFITGDTHGDLEIYKLDSHNFPEGQKLTKDDYVIICGDFGLVWGGRQDKIDKTLQDWLALQPWTTLSIDGNHENHDLLNEYPIEMWSGGKVHRINESIIHLMRGEIYEINQRTFFAFGGGYSIDRQYRKEGISCWQAELPTHSEVDNALYNLKKHGNKVDYVLTHDAPRDIKEYLGFYSGCNMRMYRDEYEDIHNALYLLKKTIQFDEWYLDHYHIDKDIGNIHILYNRIIEL